MSKKTASIPITLGEMKPGDTCDVFGYGRIKVTGKLDCGGLFRRIVGDAMGEPEVLPLDTPVLNVTPRIATAEGKLGDSDPLRGGAR